MEEEEILKEETMTATSAIFYSLLFVVPIWFAIKLSFIGIWGAKASATGIVLIFEHKWLSLSILIAGIIVHEALHGITWARYCKEGLKSIKCGIKWQYLTPYAHCKEPLQVRHYRIGGVMPGLILGILPAVMAMFTGNACLMWFGLFFSIAAGGDALVLWKLRKYKGDCRVKDHPSKIGFIIIREQVTENLL